jgi:hypothetical protein
MGRLTIDLTDQQHRDLKAIAALQGKTIKQFAVERLFARGGKDASDEDRAWDELKVLLNARIDSALADPSSWRSFDEVWPDDGSVDQAA